MLKAAMTSKEGRHIVVLGLSHRNLERLREDGLKGFIPIDLGELGLSGDVKLNDVQILITAGETEQSMAHDLREFIVSQTEVKIDPKLKQ